MTGCSNITAPQISDSPAIAEIEQGMLGDLNQYVQQLLRQQRSGNTDAEKVLIRLLAGKGLPETVAKRAD
ncbi:hypothetical protein EHB58_23990 [Salmonella enterica subsp. enterica serovar Hull]|uniref:Uncharacterized protein n=1 Tax=Salmonella enterica subsp. enterica serovar Hull TaxID=1403564 RepID=A0A5X4PLN5_SALET|nr:hypothetical protein [Salmonella enterica subsp. enterica serovar Putten]EBZ7588769.1 hypothetical protein [Salmonella enterica subsp. enterica serovar Hull]EBZ8651195.1 hypothetical protein [Salmonella enterica subsp. enterica serovar Hull]